MTNFTYIEDIPASGNNPSNDQPNMKINTNSIRDVVNQDLYGFNQANGGMHHYVTFPENNALAAQLLLSSGLQTTPGTADATSSQLLYTNSKESFPVSCIRAFGVCPGSGSYGPVAPTNGYNITSVTRASGNATTTVVLDANVVTGTGYLVIASTSFTTGGGDQVTIVYEKTSATVFSMKTVNVALGAVCETTSISFVVLQF